MGREGRGIKVAKLQVPRPSGDITDRSSWARRQCFTATFDFRRAHGIGMGAGSGRHQASVKERLGDGLQAGHGQKAGTDSAGCEETESTGIGTSDTGGTRCECGYSNRCGWTGRAEGLDTRSYTRSVAGER